MHLPLFSAGATVLKPIREAMTKATGICEIGSHITSSHFRSSYISSIHFSTVLKVNKSDSDLFNKLKLARFESADFDLIQIETIEVSLIQFGLVHPIHLA
uniref:Uncharacterized protein n=1 Tax=Parascaris equorum TaxID=6256 RepID=A0A914RP57_PAREQ